MHRELLSGKMLALEESSMDVMGSKEKSTNENTPWDQCALHLAMRLPVYTDKLWKSLDLVSAI